MPPWLVRALLAVFAVHLVVFGRLAITRRERYYVVVSATFALLVLAFSLRIAAPTLTLGGVGIHWYPRVAAWVSAAISLVLLIKRRRARR